MSLRCTNITKHYQDGHTTHHVLDKINLTVQPGESVGILGRSGEGKSTLLHLLAGFEKADEGQMECRDLTLHNATAAQWSYFRSHELGYIYQFHHLLADLTILDNVMLPLLLKGDNRKKAKALALEALSELNLERCASLYPGQCSGGERQRAAVLRADIHQPGLVLADEPTGNLDQHHADLVLQLLLKRCRDAGRMLIIVTHDQALAKKLDTIYQLSNLTLTKV